MFNGIKLSNANYDALLNGWYAQNLHYGILFDAGNSTYCTGADARASMINYHGWMITDGGEGCMKCNYPPLIMRY